MVRVLPGRSAAAVAVDAVRVRVAERLLLLFSRFWCFALRRSRAFGRGFCLLSPAYGEMPAQAALCGFAEDDFILAQLFEHDGSLGA